MSISPSIAGRSRVMKVSKSFKYRCGLLAETMVFSIVQRLGSFVVAGGLSRLIR